MPRAILLASIFICGCRVSAGASLPLEEMPAVLLLAPVNGTWAANHLAYWREKGFDGFIFRGIVEGLDDDIWAVDGSPETTGYDDLLAREVRLAVDRLIAGGVDRNFCLLPIAPERPFFAGGAEMDAAVAHAAHAAVFCRTTGMRGIVFDTRPTSLFYDFRWDGYDDDTVSDSMLLAGAERFGRRLGRAVLREIPGAELLLIADCYPTWTPLWTAMLEGFIEAAATDKDATVHLLLESTFSVTAPDAMARHIATMARVLDAHLAQDARRQWAGRGYFSAGMQPLALSAAAGGSVPAAVIPPETFRRQLVGALLCSGAYCWVHGDERTWWSLTEQEAKTYGPLYQAGPYIPAQVGPPAPKLDSFNVHSPPDPYLRVGPDLCGQEPCFVLTSPTGAALIFPGGLNRELRLDSPQDSVPVTNLIRGDTVQLPVKDGAAALRPTADPILVDGLPVRPWALRAAIWAQEMATPESGMNGMPVQFGFSARTGLRLAGTVTATAAPGFTIHPAELNVDLDAGQSVVVDAVIRGPFVSGRSADWSIGLVLPGSEPVTRSFALPVSPRQIWGHAMDSPLAYAPTCIDIDGNGETEVFAGGITGQLARLDADGHASWSRRLSTGIRGQVTLVQGAYNQWLVAVMDPHGRLRVFSHQGFPVWEHGFSGVCLMPGAVSAPVDESPGNELVVAFSDGRVVALRQTGEMLWQQQTAGTGPGWLMTVPLLGKSPLSILVVRRGSTPSLACLNANGDVRWRTALDDDPVCAPLVLDLDGDNSAEIVTPLQSGLLESWDPATGSAVSRAVIPVEPPLAAVTAVELIKNEGIELLVAGNQTIAALDHRLSPLWNFACTLAALPAAAAFSTGSFILVPQQDARVTCLDGSGRILWEDRHAAAPSAVPPAFGQFAPSPEPELLIAGADRILRAVAAE